jgi:hypothetical protein
VGVAVAANKLFLEAGNKVQKPVVAVMKQVSPP